jgi:hypothetical protein
MEMLKIRCIALLLVRDDSNNFKIQNSVTRETKET